LQETVDSLARIVGGRVAGDISVEISGIAPLESAKPNQISFLANPKYQKYLADTGAGCVIVSDEKLCRPGKPDIVVDDPYLAFQKISRKFYSTTVDFEPGIHPTATIAPDARLGEKVSIGPHVVIGARSEIGDEVKIGPGAFIGSDVTVGPESIVYANVVVRERVHIGARVIVHAGAVIGSDGFGFARDEGQFRKIPQMGRVVVHDDVEIGANAAIDRGTMDDTVIGRGTKLDNLVHIAHNVVIGPNSALAALVGIAGSTVIGEGVLFGGQAGAVDHITIGDGAMFIAQTGATKDLPGNQAYAGFPARPLAETNKAWAGALRFDKLRNKVRELEKRVKELENPTAEDH
jgi:UDP-3-O-[3-hydroxymyristoyl] glucosamine N-acyltransferase